MKFKTLIFSLLSIWLFAGAIAAQEEPGPGPDPRPPFGKMERGLNLTEEQQAKWQDMRLQLQKDMLPLRTKLNNLRTDLKLAMTAEKFDQGKVKNFVEQMQKVRTDMQMARLTHQRAVRDMLTPEQRKKFDMHILSGKRGMKQHFGPPRHFHRPGPPEM